MNKQNFNPLYVSGARFRSFSLFVLSLMAIFTLVMSCCFNVYAFNNATSKQQLPLNNEPSEIIEPFRYEQSIYSSILTENRDLFIHLPSNHKATSIYLSVGNEKREGRGFAKGAEMLSELINRHLNSVSDFKFKQYNAHNHTSVAYISLYNGLNYLFSNHQAPALNSYKEYQQYGGIAALKAFFAKRGALYQNDTRVPVHTLAALGYTFMQEGRSDYAIKLLKSNLVEHTDNSVLYGALAFIQEQNKQHEEALTFYKMALQYFNNTIETAAMQKYYVAKIKALTPRVQNSKE